MWALRFLVAGVLVTTLGASAEAQPSVSLSRSVFPAGPDYASDVLQDPWHFSNPEDVAADPDQMLHWSWPDAATVRTIGTGEAIISNGWFRGVPAVDSNATFFYRADADAINPGRSGARFPIDPARYRKVAVKMRVPGAPTTSLAVAYWFHASILETNWTNPFFLT